MDFINDITQAWAEMQTGELSLKKIHISYALCTQNAEHGHTNSQTYP